MEASCVFSVGAEEEVHSPQIGDLARPPREERRRPQVAAGSVPRRRKSRGAHT